MDVFKMAIAFDESHNSPWDAVWYDGDDEDLYVLSSEMRLEAIWKPPSVRIEQRHQRPDVYSFQLYYAVSTRARNILGPLVGDGAEFLPLHVKGSGRLFVLHPLLRVELDKDAVVTRNEVSGNITAITKYSLVATQLGQHMHVFQTRQAPDSAARDGGYACLDILVSSKFKKTCEKHGLCGATFERIYCKRK